MIYAPQFFDPSRPTADAPAPDFPVLIWTPELKKREAWLNLIQRISDYLYTRRGSLYGGENPNQLRHYDVYRGGLDPAIYKDVESPFGYRGLLDARDYHFYHPAKQTVLGTLAVAPFKFKVSNLTPEAVRARSDHAGRLTAEQNLRKALPSIKEQTGVDLSFALDPELEIPDTEAALMSFLSQPDRHELVGFHLLQEIRQTADLQQVAIDCADDAIWGSTMAAMIRVENGQVRPERVDPREVAHVGGRGRDLVHCDMAAVHRKLTWAEAMNLHGYDLLGHEAYGTFESFLRKLRGGGLGDWTYDPRQGYFTGEMGTWEDEQAPTYQEMLNGISVDPVTWNQSFYDVGKSGTVSLTEQRGWFRMLHARRYAVERKGGKKADPELLDAFLRGEAGAEVLRFTELEEEEKPGGRFIKQIPTSKWYEYTRLGHSLLLGDRPYRYDGQRDSRSTEVRLPLVVRTSRDKSLVNLGEVFSVLCNALMLRVTELVNASQMGVSLFVNMEKLPAYLGGNLDMLKHLLVRTGIIPMYPSQSGDGEMNPDKIVREIPMNGNDEVLGRLLQLHTMLQGAYYNMVGLTPARLGQTRPSDGLGETQLSVQQGNLLTQLFYHEHGRFVNQLLQRTCDIGRQEVALNPGQRLFRLPDGHYQVLAVDKDLSYQDLNVFFENGYQAVDDKKVLMPLFQQAIASGAGLEMVEAMLALHFSEAPKEMLATFRQWKTAAQAKEAEGLQFKQQMEAASAELLKASKVDVPMKTAEMQAQAMIAVQELRNQDKAAAREQKGELSDIKEQNTREGRMQEAALAAEEPQPAAETTTTRDV